MIDADEDGERIGNELSVAKQRMRANKARLAAGERVEAVGRGRLSALPSAPLPAAQPSAPVESVAVVAAVPQKGEETGGTGFVLPSSMMQFLVAAALVAVLVVWVVERRSAVRDSEDGYGG